jgi:hypothetical protein
MDEAEAATCVGVDVYISVKLTWSIDSGSLLIGRFSWRRVIN